MALGVLIYDGELMQMSTDCYAHDGSNVDIKIFTMKSDQLDYALRNECALKLGIVA